jgi:uncharacterized protein (TIGR02246 family)
MLGVVVRSAVLAALCFVSVFSAYPAGTQARPATENESVVDEAAVRSVWSTLDARWNERDAEGFSGVFSEDVSFKFVDQDQSLESREIVRQHFAERFPGFAPDIRHLTTIRDVRSLTPDIRAVDGNVEILRDDPHDAKPVPLKTFAIFAVMVRQAERWSIRMIRIYELPTEIARAEANRTDPE